MENILNFLKDMPRTIKETQKSLKEQVAKIYTNPAFTEDQRAELDKHLKRLSGLEEELKEIKKL